MLNTNYDRILHMNTGDFLKTLNTQVRRQSTYEVCVVKCLDPKYICRGGNQCGKCIETWINEEHKGNW